MSQCVPNWDLAEPPIPSRQSFHSQSTSAVHDVPMLEYEVAELTWENGQLTMHGLGPPRLSVKPQASACASKYTWDKPARASGTLESVVNQGTSYPHRKTPSDPCTDGDFVPWFHDHRSVAAAAAASAGASAATTMDALVPCSNPPDHDTTTKLMDSMPDSGTRAVECSTRAGSCSGAATHEEDCFLPEKRARAARVPAGREWSSRDQSVSGSVPTFGMDSRQVTLDTSERDLGVGFTPATSQGSPENTSSGGACMKLTTIDDHDSVCHSTPQREADDETERKKGKVGKVKSSISTKRSRAAAIHNQSERKRRDKINQRMKTLQKLVPNSNKTDKASMLDEVIEYLKQLQAQVQMMSRMNMPAMMLPMAMQQQLPMTTLMAPMGLGMGMGMGVGVGVGVGMGMGMGMGLGMDHLNMIPSRPSLAAGISPLLHPAAFMPITAWDGGTCDQLQATPAAAMMADPLSAFFACQSQPMTMEAYSRIAAMFQQFHQHQASAGCSKN